LGNHKYTTRQIDFIRDNITGRNYADLAKLFNQQFGTELTQSKIANAVYRYGYNNGQPQAEHSKPHYYTTKQIDFIKSNITGRRFKELTEMFNEHFGLNLSETQIMGAAYKRSLHNGLTSRIPCKPIGFERIDKRGYIKVKTAYRGKWRNKQAVVWEEANGPIPPGHVLIFADGNRQNCDLGNLLLVTKREMVIMSTKGLIYTRADLTKVGIRIAGLHIAITNNLKKR